MIKKMSVYLGNERADSNYIVSYFAGLKIISGQTPLLIKKKTHELKSVSGTLPDTLHYLIHYTIWYTTLPVTLHYAVNY